MPLECLRPDLPAAAFAVTELEGERLRAKLDQNEAPVDLPAPLKREIADALARGAWNRYPQPRAYAEAKAALARAVGLPPEAVALTVGCDQVIQAAFLLAGGPGRRARWFEPAYPYIPLQSRATGTIGEGVILGPDVDAAVDAAAVLAPPAPHLAVLVTPGNPTGGLIARAAIDAALADPGRLVLVDEAYADFAPLHDDGARGDDPSVLAEAPSRPNLLVGRSLSKSLLAGVRLGFAAGHPDLVAALERLYTAPYHLNALQLLVAARYAEIRPHVEAAAAEVARERARVTAALAAMPGLAPRPSRANFVLFAVAGGAEGAGALHAALAGAGVRVRDVGGLPGLAGYLRVTIGTRAENDCFLAAVTAAGEPGRTAT